MSLCANAQNDPMEFMGIPIDGTKTEMIKKLKHKGFEVKSKKNGYLIGQYLGFEALIKIVDENNDVYAISVCNNYGCSEYSIKNKFNNLCQQFENSPKYFCFSDCSIPQDEDIAFEIDVNEKKYKAKFYQTTMDIEDQRELRQKVTDEYLEPLSPELRKYYTDTIPTLFNDIINDKMIVRLGDKIVSMTIDKFKGEYYLFILFIDNRKLKKMMGYEF